MGTSVAKTSDVSLFFKQVITFQKEIMISYGVEDPL